MSTKETLKNENPFVRVGTALYKIVSQPRLNGGHVKKRIVWNNETLRQDYGKDYLAGVPKYDGFCTVPGKHGQTDPVRTVQIDPFKTVETDPVKTEQTDPPLGLDIKVAFGRFLRNRILLA